MLMRRILGAATVALLLTGCGSAPPTGPAPAPAIDFTEIALVSATAAGGRVSATPARVDDPAAVAAFGDRFRGTVLGRRVRAVVRRADVGADRVLLAAVVAIGCDVPPGVRVDRSSAGPRITALPVESPLPECFAPVTTVAVVSVPADAL